MCYAILEFYGVQEIQTVITFAPPENYERKEDDAMPFKFLIFALGLCVFSAFTITLAGNAPESDQQINKRINYLKVKAQISGPSTERSAQQKQKKTPSRMTSCYQAKKYNNRQYQEYHTSSSLGIGPYLNKDAIFDGSKLIINVPTVREDSRLLAQQYQLIQECHELDIPTPDLPRLTLTGKLESQISYGSAYTGGLQKDNIFNGAELDAYVQGNSWVSGYMALDYAPDEHRYGSRLFMNRAFIAIGNLSQFPFYISIGQVYIPFGRYSSLMVTAPVTQALGRTKARTLTFGYYQKMGKNNNVLHTEVYGFQGLSNNNNLARSNQNNEWGTDVGYEFDNGCRLSGEIGAGYISSFVDFQEIQDKMLFNIENIRHHVPALNVYGTLAINPVVFFTEYVGAMRSFDVNDIISISFTNQGARRRRPTAFHTEASYRFRTGSKTSSIGVGYGHTSQALALGLPQDRYSIFYNINIWRDTNLALEYRHDINYRDSAIVSLTGNPMPDAVPVNVVTDFGKIDNVVTAQFDLFF